MKELLTKVTAFQEEAVSLLSQEMPDSEAIAKMVDTGCSLDIDLPELPRLKHKLQQVCFDVFFFFYCFLMKLAILSMSSFCFLPLNT